MRIPIFAGCLALTLAPLLCQAASADWPQFRGPGGSSVSPDGRPPIVFGPKTNLLWKTELPDGRSSPCIIGDRIFLTTFDKKTLETICLNRKDGKILWHRAAPVEKAEPTHRLGSPASPTPVCDGERLYVYFGSYGLICYDLEGNEKWYHKLPTPMVEFGTSSSPILAGDRLILACDQDLNSYLIAVDRRTGEQIWRTDRSEFRRSFATPIVWRHDQKEELIVPGSVWLKSYDIGSGAENWSAQCIARVACASPVAGDGLLFVSSWNVGGDEGDRLRMPPFDEVAQQWDKNKDGKFTRDEIPKGPFLDRFSQIDLNKDNVITREEWDMYVQIFEKSENSVVAIKPGGHGDITKTHIAWKQTRSLPYISSPLLYGGRLYTIKNGGLASCYEAKTGKVLYQDERLGEGGSTLGDFYSSAVGADGRVYVASQRGMVIVLEAGDTLKVLARNDLGETTMATPAIVGGNIYYRTERNLYAFGTSN